MRDETLYPEASVFRPDRFIGADGQLIDDDRVLAFGFGRRCAAVWRGKIKIYSLVSYSFRICVGKHVASASVSNIPLSHFGHG